MTVSARELNRTTLLRPSLLARFDGSVADAIGRLAGIQAQHSNAPHVALWSRVEGFESSKLERALERRSVVKATTIRSTLYLVAAGEYRAFDAASAVPRVEVWRATVRRSGVDVTSIHQKVLEYAREPRSVDDMEAYVAQLAPGARLASHAPGGLTRAAFRIVSANGGLVHAPPSGFWNEHRRPRYVAARTWLKDTAWPTAEEALQVLLRRYLGAYGAASLADFGRWVGDRRQPRLRKAVDGLGDEIRRERTVDGRELLDLVHAPMATGDEDVPARFLSRWDSVIIGYDDRTKIPKAMRATLEEEGERLVRFVERDADRHEFVWDG